MLNVGSRISRFEYTSQSAWKFVDQLNRTTVPLQLQMELVDGNKNLSQTAAGSALYQWRETIITQLRELLVKLVRGHGKSPEEINTWIQLEHTKSQKVKLAHHGPRNLSGLEGRVRRQTTGSDPHRTSNLGSQTGPEPRKAPSRRRNFQLAGTRRVLST